MFLHLWKPNVHYRIHNTRNLCPSRIIWVQCTLQLYFLQTHFNSVLPATPRFCKWNLSMTSHHQNPLNTSSVSHTCHIPRPSHFSWFNYPNNIGWDPRYAVPSSPLSPRPSEVLICSLAPCSQTPSALVSSWIWTTEFYTHAKQHAKLRFLYLVFAFLHRKRL